MSPAIYHKKSTLQRLVTFLKQKPIYLLILVLGTLMTFSLVKGSALGTGETGCGPYGTNSNIFGNGVDAFTSVDGFKNLYNSDKCGIQRILNHWGVNQSVVSTAQWTTVNGCQAPWGDAISLGTLNNGRPGGFTQSYGGINLYGKAFKLAYVNQTCRSSIQGVMLTLPNGTPIFIDADCLKSNFT